jgi:hypothetical protein
LMSTWAPMTPEIPIATKLANELLTIVPSAILLSTRRAKRTRTVAAPRDEVELRLCSLQVALPQKPPGPYCDFRLDDVVPGTKRINIGIEERRNAVLLIRSQTLVDGLR